MKIILALLALASVPSFGASQKLTTTGLQKTTLDFVWKISVKETPWSGQLDCQSFIHYLKLTDSKKDIVKYLDPNECEDWHERLEEASERKPLCLSIDEVFSIRQIDC